MSSGGGLGESECFVAKMVRALLPLLPLFEAELCLCLFTAERCGGAEEEELFEILFFCFTLCYMLLCFAFAFDCFAFDKLFGLD